MPVKQKWMPDHWRSGCWVDAYQRSNGVYVSRHWRSGGPVESHYCVVNDSPNRPPGQPNDPGGAVKNETDRRGIQPAPPRIKRRTHWPEPPPRSRTGKPGTDSNQHILDHIPLVLAPHSNNAALAIALDQLGPYRVRPNRQNGRGRKESGDQRTTATGEARITGVSWTEMDGTENRAGELTLAANSLKLPNQVRRITIETTVTHPNGLERRMELESPIFFNQDGTASTTEKARMDPEEAVRMLKALAKSSRRDSHRNGRRDGPGGGETDALRAARSHNQVRAQLGGSNPEQAVQRALTETLKLIPPPALGITRTLRVSCPGAEYVITVSPRQSPETKSNSETSSNPETNSNANPKEKQEIPAHARIR